LVLGFVLVVFGVGACSVTGGGPGVPVPSGEASKLFFGTAREHVEARMACVERHGLVVVPGDPNDVPSFEVSFGGVGEDRVDEVLGLCDLEVGEFYQPPATVESVTGEYEWLVGQYRCLTKAGFKIDEPPSLESFLDEWRTKGHATYDPIASAAEYDQALAACPRSVEKWPE
jgi:hypothetical protein